MSKRTNILFTALLAVSNDKPIAYTQTPLFPDNQTKPLAMNGRSLDGQEVENERVVAGLTLSMKLP
jgi:hypothetical protein